MAYEQRDNSGSAFINDKKGNDKAPDYKGKAMVDGKLKQVALWVRPRENGEAYLSFKFEEPRPAAPTYDAVP